MQITVRKLSIKDAMAFKPLRLEALQNEPESFGSDYQKELIFSNETWQSRVADDQNGFSFGAFEGDKLIAFAGVKLNLHQNIKHKAFIWGVYTAPMHRGKGIGGQLLGALINNCQQIDGLEMLQLDVAFHIKAAKKLYQKFGFISYGIDIDAMRIAGKSIDLELMHLKL